MYKHPAHSSSKCAFLLVLTLHLVFKKISGVSAVLRLGQMLGDQHSGGLGIPEQRKVGNPWESQQPGADLVVSYQHPTWKSPSRARRGHWGF